MMKENFKAFTLEHKAKKQWARFEPMDDQNFVFVRFQGACGQVVETKVDRAVATDQIAHLYSIGYTERPEA